MTVICVRVSYLCHVYALHVSMLYVSQLLLRSYSFGIFQHAFVSLPLRSSVVPFVKFHKLNEVIFS